MKEKEALGLIDAGWSRKPQGFRVHFQKKINGQWQTDYVPESGYYDSDVVTWRLAWKLHQATCNQRNDETDSDMLVNIYVEDDTGAPVKYYATGEHDIFNRVDTT